MLFLYDYANTPEIRMVYFDLSETEENKIAKLNWMDKIDALVIRCGHVIKEKNIHSLLLVGFIQNKQRS